MPIRARMLLALAALLLACGGSSADENEQQTDDGYRSRNLILNGDVATSSAGWTFVADDEVEAWGSWLIEGETPWLHTEIFNGSGPGEARWIFEPISLAGGRFYEYADTHRSWGPGRLVWSCETAGGKRRHYSAWQSGSTPAPTRTAFRFYLPEACAVTVMHVLDRPGFLETTAHQLREVAPAPLARPLLSIAFDDGRRSVASVAAPALEKRGMRGTFYLVSSWLGQEGWLDETMARNLALAGHELGAHGASHQALPSIGVTELQDEIDGSLRQVEKLGGRGGFAYPFGAFDDAVELYAASRASYVRTSLHGLNDATVDPLRVRIFAVTAETSLAELTGAVDAAVATSTWLVLLFHDLGEPGGDDLYRTAPGDFEALLDYARAREIPVLPVAEALDEILGR